MTNAFTSTKFTLLKYICWFFSFKRFKSIIEKSDERKIIRHLCVPAAKALLNASNINFELHNVIYFHRRPDSTNRVDALGATTNGGRAASVFKSQCVFPNSCEHDVQQPRVERIAFTRCEERTEKERNE